MTRSNLLPWVLPAVFAAAAPAFGQALPDAGSLQQQIERVQKPGLPPAATPASPARPAERKAPEEVTLTVTAFQFSGNRLLDDARLAPVVATYLNRPIGFRDLRQAAADVAAAYRQDGWIVSAYLPQQDVSQGVVAIRIVEAVFGGARVQGPAPARLAATRLVDAVQAAQPIGGPINARQLDRSLLLLDDLAGISVSGSLEKGQVARETDLVLTVTDEPLLQGEIGIDNTGARATGADRLVAALWLNSPLGLGDQVSANAIHSRGNDYGRVAYQMPLGHDGWRVGISGSTLRYELIADAFKGLAASGTSSTTGLDARYPLLRSPSQNLYLGLNYTRKRYDNQANRATTSHYGIDNVSIALQGNRFDPFGGGGANTAGLTFTRGRVDLGTLDLSEDAALHGGFSRLNYALGRQQVISRNVSVTASLSGQIASGNLDSAERFYLGGADGVRAYPSSEGGGAEGRLINLEMRWRLSPELSVSGFYDWGQVRVNRDNRVANRQPNNVTLKGAGLALAWQAGAKLLVKATYARRIGDNLDATVNGKDQDGSLDKNRWWLTASLAF